MVTLKCLCSDSSWYSSIHSSILSIDIWSFSFSIGNSSLSSLSIRKVAFSSYLLTNSDSSSLILSMLWLNDFFVFIWSFLLLSAFALSFSLSRVYCILNLYCSSCSNHRTCLLLSCLIVIKCTRFLWFVRIVSFDNSSMYTLHNSRETTIANSFLSWTS